MGYYDATAIYLTYWTHLTWTHKEDNHMNGLNGWRYDEPLVSILLHLPIWLNLQKVVDFMKVGFNDEGDHF